MAATILHQTDATAEGASRRYARRLAPGLCEQHDALCLKSTAWPRARCTCTVTYDAWLRGDDGDRRRSFSGRADAESWLAEVRAANRAARGASAVTLSEAAEAFLVRATSGAGLGASGRPYRLTTAAAYSRALHLRVLPFRLRGGAAPLGKHPIDAIDERALQAAVDAAVERYGSAVARVTCSAIRALVGDLVERGDLEQAPEFPRLPEHDRPAAQFAYTPAEVERILRAARADDQRHHRSLMEPLIVLMLGSGASVPAALRTRWGATSLDVEARAPRVRLERPTRRLGVVSETVGLAPTVAAMLRRHRTRLDHPHDGTPVFPAAKRDGSVRTELAHAALRRIGRAADVTRLSPYGLRHTGATWADRAETDAPTLVLDDSEEASQ